MKRTLLTLIACSLFVACAEEQKEAKLADAKEVEFGGNQKEAAVQAAHHMQELIAQGVGDVGEIGNDLVEEEREALIADPLGLIAADEEDDGIIEASYKDEDYGSEEICNYAEEAKRTVSGTASGEIKSKVEKSDDLFKLYQEHDVTATFKLASENCESRESGYRVSSVSDGETKTLASFDYHAERVDEDEAEYHMDIRVASEVTLNFEIQVSKDNQTHTFSAKELRVVFADATFEQNFKEEESKSRQDLEAFLIDNMSCSGTVKMVSSEGEEQEIPCEDFLNFAMLEVSSVW